MTALPATQSFETIYKTTRRIPFSNADLQQMRVHVEGVRRAGLDLEVQSDFGSLHEMVNEGVVMLRSRELESDFLFVNVDAGRGFFGGSKRQVLTYTSDIYRGNYSPGPVLGSLIRALVGINNIYRAAGLLRGAAM